MVLVSVWVLVVWVTRPPHLDHLVMMVFSCLQLHQVLSSRCLSHNPVTAGSSFLVRGSTRLLLFLVSESYTVSCMGTDNIMPPQQCNGKTSTDFVFGTKTSGLWLDSIWELMLLRETISKCKLVPKHVHIGHVLVQATPKMG